MSVCDCESEAEGDAHSRLQILDPSSQRASGSTKCLAPASPTGSKETPSDVSNIRGRQLHSASCQLHAYRARSQKLHTSPEQVFALLARLTEPESRTALVGCSGKGFPAASTPRGHCSCGVVLALGIYLLMESPQKTLMIR